MSARDRKLIEESGLSVSKMAYLLGKKRQTVASGVTKEHDYFTPGDLETIARKAEEMPTDVGQPIQDAIAKVFRDLADRIGAAAGGPLDLVSAISSAERIWMILPAFQASEAEQPAAYHRLFAKINARNPRGQNQPMTIVVWCSSGRSAIIERFDADWYDQNLIAVVTCDLVETMQVPLVIIDPHRVDGRRSFALAASGFVPIAPALARSSLTDFALHLHKKLCSSETTSAVVSSSSPSQVLNLKAETLREAGIDSIKV
jgi:hypothetical protein